MNERSMQIPGVDYPLLKDYDDPLLFEFHEAGILTERELAAQEYAKMWNEKSLIALMYNRRFKLFPPLSLSGELTPVSGG